MSTPTLETSPTRITRSATEIRARMITELAQILKVDSSTIDTTAPLHNLGVDSLGAFALTGSLASWLDRDLPASLMWDYPTINAMAEGLADRQGGAVSATLPGVIDLQPEGDRRPIFFFPGQGGHPVTFSALATQLAPLHPCYGLLIPGFNGEIPPLTRVEDIVAVMLRNIRLIQPKGPYQLGGYSFGGLLAYETAQQLTAAGETVSLLAIYDTFTRTGRFTRPLWQRIFIHAYILIAKPDRRAYLSRGMKRLRAFRRAEVEEAKNASSAEIDPRASQIKKIRKANCDAAIKYEARPYPGSIVLFRPAHRAVYSMFSRIDPLNGWGPLTDGRVRPILIPGSHLNLLGADNAPTAAAALRPYLADKPA
jgi:thioesterase domain-containing protein/acyl carrier protein